MSTALSPTVVRWSLPILTLAWAGFLFWVSTYDRGVPLPPGPVCIYPRDLLTQMPLHMGVFGVLASLLVLSIWAVWRRIDVLLVPLTVSFVAAAAYGAALELYQTTLPTRLGTWEHAAWDAMGAGAAVAALAVLTGLRRWRGSAARP